MHCWVKGCLLWELPTLRTLSYTRCHGLCGGQILLDNMHIYTKIFLLVLYVGGNISTAGCWRMYNAPVLKRMELNVLQMTCCKQQQCVHPDRSKIDYPQKNNTHPKNIFSRLSGFLGQCFICESFVCFSTSQGQDINSQWVKIQISFYEYIYPVLSGSNTMG
jgi:hypothetical protein